MKEPPWLEPPALEVVALILESHNLAFGHPLIAGTAFHRNLRLAAQEVFAADQAVLAHDDSEDPRLIYANSAAIQLWRRPWAEMIGLPSRLTAEPKEQGARAKALASAKQQDALAGYTGIRVDTEGRRFRIEGARVWSFRDAGGKGRGQAATFSSWTLL
ncbi:MAG: MEKHLA domain-containing protein [Cyanobium sp.]